MSRRSKKKSEGGGGAPEWLTTYSDLVTLLLTFFVLLYSFSSIDALKFKEISLSLSRALGGGGNMITNGGNLGPVPVNTNPGTPSDITGSIVGEQNITRTEKEQILEEVTNFIKDNNLSSKVSIREDARGIIMELQEKILFDSGSAEIKPQSLPVLDQLSELLGKFPNEILVEGHTDNVPVNKGYYKSNWELSTDRAVRVVRYLTEQKGLKPSKFYAAGGGEYRPVDSNSTDAGRQKNRRVDILIVSSEKESSK